MVKTAINIQIKRIQTTPQNLELKQKRAEGKTATLSKCKDWEKKCSSCRKNVVFLERHKMFCKSNKKPSEIRSYTMKTKTVDLPVKSLRSNSS